jgi:hypothetical protein
MSKMKFYYRKQSRMIEGVCVTIDDYGGADYDELLREAVRVALGMNKDADEDWDDRYQRIRRLIAAYVASPEGQGEDPSILLARFAVCITDVIPVAMRRELVTLATNYESKHPDLPVLDVGREVDMISADNDEQV